MVGEYDITAHIAVKNVPEMYRQFALQAMQAGVQQGMKKKEDESDEQYAERQKMTEAQMEQMAQMINEIDSLTFGWAVDSQQQRTYLRFHVPVCAGQQDGQASLPPTASRRRISPVFTSPMPRRRSRLPRKADPSS